MCSVLEFDCREREWVDRACRNRCFFVHPEFRASVRAYNALVASGLDATYRDAVVRHVSTTPAGAGAVSRPRFYELLAFMNELNYFFQCHRGGAEGDSLRALAETLDVDPEDMEFVSISGAFADLRRIFEEHFSADEEMEDVLFESLPLFTTPVHTFFVAVVSKASGRHPDWKYRRVSDM